MREFVAVKAWADIAYISPSLKHEALLFKRIAIPGYHILINPKSRQSDEQKLMVEELQWLFEKNIVFEPKNIPLYDLKQHISDEHTAHVKRVLDWDAATRQLGEASDWSEEFWRTFNFLSLIGIKHVVRATSAQLRALNNLDAYPVFTNKLDALPDFPPLSPQDSPAQKSEVVQIVLNALPIPDDTTSWEQITEYRSDPESQGKFLDLRNWMNEVARAKLTPIEVEQKLEYLMSQYQRHMEIHKMKTNAGMLETALVTSAEILEGLARFQFSKVAKALFTFKHRRIELMEGELTSLGSEVAYVIKAREHFS